MNRADFLAATASMSLSCSLAATASAKTSVNETGFVPIGGIDQFVAIQGQDSRNPALLYVHGGPAEAQSPFLSEFQPWEQYFTVVTWDQRGSGKTFARNGTATPEVTLKQITLDTIDVAQYARRRLAKSNVVLVGQSWGCLPGMFAALRRPDIFAAYVGTGQPVCWDLSLEAREAFARTQMLAAGDTRALQALDAAQSLPPTDFKRINITNTWRWAPSDRRYLDSQRSFMGGSPDNAKGFAAQWIAGENFSGPKLWPDETAFDARKHTTFDLPVFVIQGKEDHIAGVEPAKAWLASVHAPAKAFVAIDGGHFACFTDPTEFMSAVRENTGPFIRK
ncbi:MAG TPA: alpha/beta hydrolase [Candidatus Baltobacteraceae bacterium]|nr:alpha/beta hydrolase [Candidatus Baltobacteraceae bacterium]